VKKQASLLEVLTAEISHHPILGLLAVLVLLVHSWVVVLLLRPTDQDKVAKPLKIMEVALVTKIIPEKKAEPPAPPKPAPAKIVPPKKKPVTPPVKKKAPIIPKQVDQPKIKEQKFGDEKMSIPVQASPSVAVQKPQQSASTSKSTVDSRPVAKSGNADSKSKGANSGVVELGCPKPNYPNRAMSRHIEGWVKIELTIGTAGTVTNASVAGAQPSGIFDDAALTAAKRCRFKPKIVNGNPVQLRTSKTFRFSLTN
jgi:periplasmic protein TonB